MDGFSTDKLVETLFLPIDGGLEQVTAAREYVKGLSSYVNDIFVPYRIAMSYMSDVERMRIFNESPLDNILSLIELMKFNLNISAKSTKGTLRAINDYTETEMGEVFSAFLNTLFYQEGEDLKAYFKRRAHLITAVSQYYPEAISEIAPEFGFHFGQGYDEKVAETERFVLYRIYPTHKKVTVDMGSKPVLIIPPYVLGANILSFLPGENRSYTHAFANQGIPTYIRILKDIETNVSVQTMDGEDDTRDTAYFCKIIKQRHQHGVTLNGYCQGGFSAVCSILSGELDGLVDALITCVSPIDGTRSVRLANFLKALPPRFNDLMYGSKTLESGHVVADGKLMGWVYKLKSIEKESPLVSFYRDLVMIKSTTRGVLKFNKTGLALNYWLKNDRSDIPMGITKMSFASFNTPITKDGTLPVRLFNRKLNLNRIKDKKIPWLICYGEKDDLVESQSALAAKDYIPVETTPFPKGHVAIATSWSHPQSDYALHTCFGDIGQFRGPIRFHLDLK
ncbi:MAG: metal transporter [Proteobacteria bacterium]|nr:metal transporter [Pseudomonadota bacterium]